jgi:hypothetical protein
MEWWVGVILVAVVLAAVFMFFERRSWKRPLPRGRESGSSPGWTDNPTGAFGPLGRHSDLGNPRE